MKYASIKAAALLLAASLAVTGAEAQGMDANVRCLLASNLFANGSKDAKAKTLANAARLFYAGRISALPAAQIQAALASQQKLLTPANAGPTMTACAQGMDRALKSLQAAGQKLQPQKP